MFTHVSRNAAIALVLASAGLAGTAAPSLADKPCDRPVPPEWCSEQPDPDVNHTPSVSIKADKLQVVRGETVHFTGTADDLDEGTPSFAYDVNTDDTFDDFANQLEFDHRYATLGDKVVRIRATDIEGASATASVTIKVVNRAPTLKIEGPTTLLTGETGTYEATASDPDGDPVTVSWGSASCRDIINGEGTGLTKELTAPTFPTETLPVCAIATDGQPGGYSAKEQLFVKVVNRRPIAAIAFAPAAPIAGDTVTFDSSASRDEDGTIVSRAWDTNGDGAFDDGTAVTAQRAFTAAGTYKAAVKLTDDHGDSTVKEIAVTVAAKPVDSGGSKPPETPGGGTALETPGGGKAPETPGAPRVPDTPVPSGATANASTLSAKLTRKGKVKTLKVKGAQGPIAVACTGRGCSFTARTVTHANLKGLFRKALKRGARITIVTGDGTTVATRTFTVKVGKAGKARVAIA